MSRDPLQELLEAVQALRLDGQPLTVLTPEQADVPQEYGPENGLGRATAPAQGLSYYLAAHPAGFVQLAEPAGSFSDKGLRSYLCVVYAVAPTRAAARLLCEQLLTLAGDSRTPGPLDLLTPEAGAPLADGTAYRFQFTFSLTLI